MVPLTVSRSPSARSSSPQHAQAPCSPSVKHAGGGEDLLVLAERVAKGDVEVQLAVLDLQPTNGEANYRGGVSSWSTITSTPTMTICWV
eukprot:10867538-Heterocapsa_arctica.AAC.1